MKGNIRTITKKTNERKTEIIVRDELDVKGYYNNSIIVEEQSSDNPIVCDLLSGASKKLTGNAGYPEFLITKPNSNLIIVIECKAKLTEHKSKDLNVPDKYAVDGVLHYASFLKEEYDVIAIAVSGSTKSKVKIDTYLWRKMDIKYKNLEWHEIRTYDEYEKELIKQSTDMEYNIQCLMSYAKDLHEEMRDYAKLSESEKPLLVSGILIALHHETFRRNYKTFNEEEIAEEVCSYIEKVLKKGKIPEEKRNTLITVWNFITAKEEFKGINNTIKMNLLTHFIDKIYRNVRNYINPECSVDVIGKFYGEFLKYTGGDGKGLGIVLTPQHITELFVQLANLTTDSIVLDTCAGTGGFLISAMKDMFEKANGDQKIIENIKKNNLIGVEQQPNMYALVCANMILRGDGKSNLYLGSCFDEKIIKEIKNKKPNIGFINPPYSQKGEGLSELNYISNILNCLEKNSLCFAIVPMSCATDTKKNSVSIKEKILENNTLEAVMSMPDELFYPTGVITCIMVFRTGIKHDSDIETWFGYWKNDGFIKTKNNGRVDKNKEWNGIKNEWVTMFKNKKEISGKSVKVNIAANKEWCAEAYLETDYSKLTKEMFEQKLKEYALFKITNE